MQGFQRMGITLTEDTKMSFSLQLEKEKKRNKRKKEEKEEGEETKTGSKVQPI